jgi:hypothetical protein
MPAPDPRKLLQLAVEVCGCGAAFVCACGHVSVRACVRACVRMRMYKCVPACTPMGCLCVFVCLCECVDVWLLCAYRMQHVRVTSCVRGGRAIEFASAVMHRCRHAVARTCVASRSLVHTVPPTAGPSHVAATAPSLHQVVERTGRRAVMVAGWSGVPAVVGDGEGQVQLPPELLLVSAAPHDWLLPRCCVCVHHAGVGAHGPQVIHPGAGVREQCECGLPQCMWLTACIAQPSDGMVHAIQQGHCTNASVPMRAWHIQLQAPAPLPCALASQASLAP